MCQANWEFLGNIIQNTAGVQSQKNRHERRVRSAGGRGGGGEAIRKLEIWKGAAEEDLSQMIPREETLHPPKLSSLTWYAPK